MTMRDDRHVRMGRDMAARQAGQGETEGPACRAAPGMPLRQDARRWAEMREWQDGRTGRPGSF